MSNEITQFDRPFEDLDEESLLLMLPTVVAERLKAIPEEIKLLTEEELLKLGRGAGMDIRLRTAFWLEYERAKRTGKSMNMKNVYPGSCSHAHFFREVVGNSHRLAYITSPPIEVQIGLEELMLMGLSEMKKVMEMSNIDAKGNVDTKLIDVKRKIFEDVTNRRRGHVLRKTEVQTKSVSLNLNGSIDKTPGSLEELDAQLAELEDRSLPPPRATRDIIEQVQALDVEEKETVKEPN